MTNTLRISFPVLASANIVFEIDARVWECMPEETKQSLLMSHAVQASYTHLENEHHDERWISASVIAPKNIDLSDVEIDDYKIDAAMEEGCRYERAFGDGSDVS